MRITCPTCPRQVTAPDQETGRRLLALFHDPCENAPVDPDNDPRRPRDDVHAEQMERQRLGITR